MAQVHGIPARHLREQLDAARDEAAWLQAAGVDPADTLDGAAAAYARWWDDPDVDGLMRLLEAAQAAAAGGNLAAATAWLAEVDVAAAEQAAPADPVATVVAVHRAVRLRAAVDVVVRRLAAGPDLTDAFEAVRAAAGDPAATAEAVAAHPEAFAPRALADLRLAAVLRPLASRPDDTGTVPGFPLQLAVSDDPWSDHRFAPMPAGTPVPGGHVVTVVRQVAGRQLDDQQVRFDDACLAALQAGQDPIVDPYDWARSRHRVPAPARRYVPAELERAFEPVAELARDRHHRRWRAGIHAEEQVADVLDRLPVTVVLHGAALDGGDADHVVAGPCLAVVETKAGRGRVSVRPAEGDGAARLQHGGGILHGEGGTPVGQVLRQADALTARLAAHGIDTSVAAIVCVTGMRNRPLHVDGVTVCGLDDLADVVATLPPVDVDPADVVAALAGTVST